MLGRGFAVSLAVLLAFGIFAESANAEHRSKHRRVIVEEDYYPPPPFIGAVPGLRIFFGDYALSEEEFDELYGRHDRRSDERYDERYYEPEFVKPKRKATKEKAQKPDKKKTAAKPAKQAPKKDISAVQKKVPAAKSAALSCEKAGSVVTGYGFSSVTPSSCEGKVYAFNAQRDGKSFAIKLDPASGELTEVKKLP
jgi:hypothetical protein